MEEQNIQVYNFHFSKLLGWCTEWAACDPISGPISGVANFLADLHSQVYLPALLVLTNLQLLVYMIE